MVQSIFKMESQTKQGQSSSEGEYTEKISNAIWVCQPRGSHKWQQTQNRSLCSCWFVYCYFKFCFFIPTHRQWWMECVSLVLVCADQRRNWCIDRVGRQIIAPPNGNTVECSRFSIEVKITIPKQYNSTSYDKRHTHVGRVIVAWKYNFHGGMTFIWVPFYLRIVLYMQCIRRQAGYIFTLPTHTQSSSLNALSVVTSGASATIRCKQWATSVSDGRVTRRSDFVSTAVDRKRTQIAIQFSHIATHTGQSTFNGHLNTS